MADAPTYGGLKAAPAPLPNTRISPEAPAGAFGSEAPVLDQAAKIFEDARRRGDQLAVQDADVAMSKVETDILFHPDTGALNQHGKLAVPASDKAMTDYQRESAKVEKGLNGADQILAFRRMVANRQGQMNETLTKHVGSELAKYDVESTSASIQAAQDEAGLHYDDPDRVDGLVDKAHALTTDFGTRHGLPQSEIDRQAFKERSEIRAMVVDRYLAKGDTRMAADSYARYKDQIEPSVAAKIERALKSGALDDQSQEAADSIYADVGSVNAEAAAVGLPQPQPTLQTYLDEVAARQKKDGWSAEMRDKTESRLTVQWNRDKSAAAAQHDVNFRTAYEQKMATGRIDPSIESKLTPFESHDLDTWYEQANKPGPRVDTNFGIVEYTQAQDLAIQAPDKFLELGLPYLFAIGQKVSKEKFDDLLKTREGILKKDQATADTMKQLRSDKEVISEVLSDNGLPTHALGPDATWLISHPDAKNEYAAFSKRLEQSQKSWQEAHKGVAPHDDDLRDMASKLMVKIRLGKTERGLYWKSVKDKRVFFLKHGDEAKLEIQDIPLSDRQRIGRELSSIGTAPTDEAVKKAYVDENAAD